MSGLHKNGDDWFGGAQKVGHVVYLDIDKSGTIHTKQVLRVLLPTAARPGTDLRHSLPRDRCDTELWILKPYLISPVARGGVMFVEASFLVSIERYG